MSYILDALKKSEQQRRAAAVSTVLPAHEPDGPAPAQPMLRIGVVFSLLLTVALLVFWWLSEQSRTPAPVTVDVPIAPVPEITRRMMPVAEETVVTPPVQTIPLPAVEADTPTDIEMKIEDAATVQPPVVTVVAAEAPSSTSSDRPAGSVTMRRLPPLESLRRIPALMINSHIYSPLPEKRSVTMNNRVWHEGEQITDGISVQEITPKGVLLNVDGWPLTIDRQQGWTPVPN